MIAEIALIWSFVALAMAFVALALVRTLRVHLDPNDLQRVVEQEVSRQLKKQAVAVQYGDQIARVLSDAVTRDCARLGH